MEKSEQKNNSENKIDADSATVSLKEIHHRVKNNLNIIIGLLELQSQNVEDITIREMFRESINRIRSMAIIHEYLYRRENQKEIDLAVYFESLVDNLVLTYSDGKKELIVNYKNENIMVPVDIAIPLGLIVNEVVTNSIQHAFINKNKCHIDIQLTQGNNHLLLIIRDDGIGMPVDFDAENSKSLGFRLIKLLVGQLVGTFNIYRENGTVVQIEIPFK